jgi:hypothetical protein
MVALAGASILVGASFSSAVRSVASSVRLPIFAEGAVLALGGVALILGVVLHRRGRSSPHRYGSLVVGISAAVALAVGTGAFSAPVTSPPVDPSRVVTSAESGAAQWLRAHSRPTDVVATNVHCLARKTVEHCDARAFWVGALTERQVYIGGWAYTSAAREMHGREGLTYKQQRFHDPARFAANEAVFANPTAAAVDHLRSAGVRFLYADELASPVSPKLADVARLVHRDGTVSIYEF